MMCVAEKGDKPLVPAHSAARRSGQLLEALKAQRRQVTQGNRQAHADTRRTVFEGRMGRRITSKLYRITTEEVHRREIK
jgi:hypothetical protein